MRLNIGFVDSSLVKKIQVASRDKKISISQYIEAVISFYFDENKDDKIGWISYKNTKINKRVNVTFKNKSLLVKVSLFSEKIHLSKSRLIEFIIKKHFMANETDNKNDEITNYFELAILRDTIKDRLITYTDTNWSKKSNNESIFPANPMTYLTNDLLFEHYCVEININANSINIDVLNKHYIEKLKSVITDKILLRCYSDKYQGFAYIALVNNAQLMFRKTIFQNPKNEGIFSDKIPKPVPTKRKNKYIYSFEIDSLILRIGKISTEEANGKSKIVFTPFDKKGVLKRTSKYIDLASIEFVSNKRMDEYNKKPNYYQFLSKIIKSGGAYYIKLIDKQQSIKELVKKKNIYKIDKKYYLKENPNYNLFKSIENKISIINILPISQYTKRKGYTNKICCFEP